MAGTPGEQSVGARPRLAERLQRLQAKSGKSLKELERTVHASDSSLSRYLSGRIVPPWQVVEQLCAEAGEQASSLKELWDRARLERNEPPDLAVPLGPAANAYSRRRRLALGLTVTTTAVAFAAGGLWAGATWFPRTVIITQRSTSDQACKDWPWPPDAGQAVERPSRPAATDHHPAATLTEGVKDGHTMVWAQLTGAIYGDRVWMDYSTDNAATWIQCGPFLATGPTAASRAHDLDPHLKFRACADTTYHKQTVPADACTTFW